MTSLRLCLLCPVKEVASKNISTYCYALYKYNKCKTHFSFECTGVLEKDINNIVEVVPPLPCEGRRFEEHVQILPYALYEYSKCKTHITFQCTGVLDKGVDNIGDVAKKKLT